MLILNVFKKNPARIQLAFQRQPARFGSENFQLGSARLAKFQLEGITNIYSMCVSTKLNE